MIYITGDTHGDQNRFFDLQNNHGEATWTNDDYLIVCGDFGYIFFNDASENAFLDELEQKPYTICFLDGNHENFPAIFSYPEEQWNGGRIHRIRKNIIHLMRSQVFEIDGHTFFTMGGGYSIDRYMRRLNESYWEEELPSDAEYKEAIANLKKHDMQVDFMLSHTAPKEIVLRMGYHPDPHEWELEGFLEYLMYEVRFKRWYIGHWHEDREILDKYTALWFNCVKLPQE